MALDTIARALSYLDAAAMTAFLRELVRAPSVYLPGVPGANEERAARLVYDQLVAWGWQPSWEEVAPGRPNVVAELVGSEGRAGRLLLFEGHTDVVTPGDLAQWRHEPFGGEIVDRQLYGRGAGHVPEATAAASNEREQPA